ncbi:hypothetical protein PMAYCL1PPCAC_20844, partial [Pristionchus mayeri]
PLATRLRLLATRLHPAAGYTHSSPASSLPLIAESPPLSTSFSPPPPHHHPPSRPSPRRRSPSPDYWAMADEHQRGTKQWLHKMILSVLIAHSTRKEKKEDDLITVGNLSSLLHSYDSGREEHHKPVHFTDAVNVLGYR